MCEHSVPLLTSKTLFGRRSLCEPTCTSTQVYAFVSAGCVSWDWQQQLVHKFGLEQLALAVFPPVIQNIEIQKYKNIEIQTIKISKFKISKFKISKYRNSKYRNSKYRNIEIQNIKISKFKISKYRNSKYQKIEIQNIEISDYRNCNHYLNLEIWCRVKNTQQTNVQIVKIRQPDAQSWATWIFLAGRIYHVWQLSTAHLRLELIRNYLKAVGNLLRLLLLLRLWKI